MFNLLVYDYDNTALSRTYLETYGAAHHVQYYRAWAGRIARARARQLARPRSADHSAELRARRAERGAEPVVQLMIDATDSNAATALGNYGQRNQCNFARNSGIGGSPTSPVA